MPAITRAVVTCATRLSGMDTRGTPKPLTPIGERTLIHHVLQQLHEAGLQQVALTLGFEGARIREHIEQNHVFGNMEINFVECSTDLWAIGGTTACLLHAKAVIGDHPFILAAADHIFEPQLMKRICNVQFEKEEGVVLVERDMEGMVGMPSSVKQVEVGPNNKVINIGNDVTNTNALDAGVFAVTPAFWEYAERLAAERPYFSLAETFQEMALAGNLTAMDTNGATWFAIETTKSLKYALKEHEKHDTTSWFKRRSHNAYNISKGISVAGSSRKRSKSQTGGGDWSEFSVEKWRSAVYKAASYFEELYHDTIDFGKQCLEECGGPEHSSLVEVGCGTGEFVYAMSESCKNAIGIDINPQFIKWCREHTPTSYRQKSAFLVGDATKLEDCMKQTPASMKNTKKVVACIGNTFGILPAEIKDQIIDRMAETAGSDGLVFIVYWNAAWFKDAIVNFYGKNPQLCGEFQEKDVDYATNTLRTPSGYSTKWTSVKEAHAILRAHGLLPVRVEERGKGVLVAARLPPKRMEEDINTLFQTIL